MLTLSQKLAAGIAATTAVAAVALAAPQAQAASLTTLALFEAGETITSGDSSATGLGLGFNPSSIAQYTVDIEKASANLTNFTLGRGGRPSIRPGQTPVTIRYSLTTAKAVKRASFNADTTGNVVGLTGSKSIYADPAFSVLLGAIDVNTLSLESIGNVNNLTTLYIVDTLSFTGAATARFNGYSNSFVVPEPMTMLGASAAVAFGAAFKRRQAKKG